MASAFVKHVFSDNGLWYLKQHLPSFQAFLLNCFPTTTTKLDAAALHLVRAPTQAAEGELLRLSNRVRFIKGVISGSLRVNNRKKSEVEADLEAQQFDRLPSKAKVKWAC
jgi:hypothetical protein